MDLIDSRDIKFSCPRCGKQLTEKLGRLKNNPTISCPGCNQKIAIDATEARAGLDKASKALGNLGKAIKKLSKP